MVIQWKQFVWTINEIYGPMGNSDQLLKADVDAFFQQGALINPAKWNSLHKVTKTLCLDLNKSEEQLRSELNKSTRYQINKAGRDELTIQVITTPSAAELEAFQAFFNDYAKEKGIGLFQKNRVKAMVDNGMVVITYAVHKTGQKLAGHLYIADGGRASMFYSCSIRLTTTAEIPVNEVGRANRYLHWHNIVYFKNQTYQVYDFFGLTMDEDDIEHQNINRFKKSFGGEEVTEYRSIIPRTLMGNLLVFLLKLKWRSQVETVKGGIVRKKILKEQRKAGLQAK